MGRKRKDNACSETTDGEKINPHTDHNSNAMEAMNIENNATPYSNGLPSKKINSKVTNVVIRRSDRLKNSVLLNGCQKVEPTVEHVNLVESEKEEASNHHQVSTLPVLSERNLEEEAPLIQQLNNLPVVKERNLEGKVNHIVRVVDELKSKTFKQVTRRQIEGPSTDYGYKRLYIDSQKKIEALMEKHYELVRKLEFAHGKIDAYEKMNNAMGAAKEVILVSRLEKDAEAMSLSPQTVQICISAAAPDADDDQNASPKQTKNNYKKKMANSGKC
ncbi:hypothetical protein Pfo_006296 [Paulownia fortunei]|nr:hypothetical protein Pfo_006296 [Paulownia fortunei]